MIYVPQETPTSCGIACVAMLAGCSFADAGKALGKVGLTRGPDLIDGLNTLGLRCDKLRKAFWGFDMVIPQAIAKVSWPDKRTHWIVVLDHEVYDPANINMYRLDQYNGYGRVVSYLEVYKY